MALFFLLLFFNVDFGEREGGGGAETEDLEQALR